jgi:hypothetical protein
MPVHQFGGSILVIVGRSARAAAVGKNKSDANTVDRTGRQMPLMLKVLERLACTSPPPSQMDFVIMNMNPPIPIARQPHAQSPLAQLFFILSSPAKAIVLQLFRGRDSRLIVTSRTFACCYDVSFAHSEDQGFTRGWAGCRGYCGLAIGLVELVGAFCRLSTNVMATEQRVHFVRCSRVTGYPETNPLPNFGFGIVCRIMYVCSEALGKESA